MKEANAHQVGKTQLPSVRVELTSPDVREIRKRLKLSQESFAGLLGFSLPAVRA
jgi:DNA-binding transcriptional regulator YiaG